MSYVINGIRVAGNWFGYKGCSVSECGNPGTHFVIAEGKYVFALYCEEDAKKALSNNTSWLTAMVLREELEP